MPKKIVVLVSCGNLREARRIAQIVVVARLAACANVFRTPVESVYRWKGEVESAKEFLVLIKTSRGQFPALQKQVRRMHSYDVPEIIALPIVAGSGDYLAWISESLRPGRK